MKYTIKDVAYEVGKSYVYVYAVMRKLHLPLPGHRGLSEDEYFHLCQTVRDYMNDRFSENPSIRIGADPEFEIVNSYDQVEPARTFFRDPQGRAEVGCDGADHTGELRPKPSKSPEELNLKISKLLRQVKEQLPEDYHIRAGAGVSYPLGGHIHFSNRISSNDLVEKLEMFIAAPLNEKSNNSLRGYYADPLQTRWQPHGWEYRTPCSWIAHPDLSQGALSIAWCLANSTDIELRQINTREELFETMGNRRGEGEKFYEVLNSVSSLEEIKVFRAWEIEEGDPFEKESESEIIEEPISSQNLLNLEPTLITPFISRDESSITGYPLLVSTEDLYMSYIQPALVGIRVSTPNLLVVGAANSRSYSDAIFLPAYWTGGTEEIAYITTWSLNMTIGISRSLRERIRNSANRREILSQLRETIIDILRHNGYLVEN